MTKKIETALQHFQEKMQLLKVLNSAQALLSWDRESHMPKGAASDRGQTTSALAGHTHELFTESTFVHAVETLFEAKTELSPEWARIVSLTHRELKKSLSLSKQFVEETDNIVNHSIVAWLDAKQKNDFSLFEPHLTKIVANRRQYAELVNPDSDPYDICLEDHEEGLRGATLQPVFDKLKTGLEALLPKIMAKQKHWPNPLNAVDLDRTQLKRFLEDMAQTIGFDLSRGCIDEVEHPFEISISENDVRANTNFKKNESSFSIMGLVHETGHALYEQNSDPKYSETFLNGGVSFGIHESQSRLLENIIGRSTGFWTFFLPKLQNFFPELRDVTVEQIVGTLNEVRPSFIRTEADEVTYNLHIILRFEIERDLMHQKLEVKDVPEVWRAKMKELVGVEPTTHREAELQDIHWAWANIGYFPTYALGNLNAAQLFAQFAKTHPQWETEVSRGEFQSYFSWFKSHIWQHGLFYTPEQIMMQSTGEKTNGEYLLKYLREKYLA